MIRLTGRKFETWQSNFSFFVAKSWRMSPPLRLKRDGSTKFGIQSCGFVVPKFSAVLSFSHCDTAGTPSDTSMPNFVIGRYFFFFQAEDGIRDGRVTGVQTCALPI